MDSEQTLNEQLKSCAKNPYLLCRVLQMMQYVPLLISVEMPFGLTLQIVFFYLLEIIQYGCYKPTATDTSRKVTGWKDDDVCQQIPVLTFSSSSRLAGCDGSNECPCCVKFSGECFDARSIF